MSSKNAAHKATALDYLFSKSPRSSLTSHKVPVHLAYVTESSLLSYAQSSRAQSVLVKSGVSSVTFLKYESPHEVLLQEYLLFTWPTGFVGT